MKTATLENSNPNLASILVVLEDFRNYWNFFSHDLYPVDIRGDGWNTLFSSLLRLYQKLIDLDEEFWPIK